MSNTPWRARREAYLRESGRTVDLIREGFVNNGLAVINGGGRRRQIRQDRPVLIVVNPSLATGNIPTVSIQRERTADDTTRNLGADLRNQCSSGSPIDCSEFDNLAAERGTGRTHLPNEVLRQRDQMRTASARRTHGCGVPPGA
jgi:hypothetical protein